MTIIRDYRESDLQAFVEANNAYYEDMPTTADQRVHEQQARAEALQAHEYVGEVDGEPVVFGLYLKALWLSTAGRGWIHHIIHPRFSGHPIEREMVSRLCRHSLEAGDDKTTSTVADKHPHHVDALLQAGFQIDQRQPVTSVDLQQLDLEPFQPIIRRLQGEGIEIVSLNTLAERWPDWKHPFYELHCALICDVPMQEAPRPMPYDLFEKMIDDPKRYELSSKFVALEGGKLVGLSEFQPNPADPTLGQTMLTGVARTHRRKGLATALKATALARARARGMRRISTDNEENNPMLELNRRLGFKVDYTFLILSKHAAAPAQT